MLYFGGKWVVDGAVAFARLFGISEFIISATIVSIGTTLPELITSIMAAKRKEIDIAIGNILGSSVFNILFILGLTSMITPHTMPPNSLFYLTYLLFSIILLFFFVIKKEKHILGESAHILKIGQGIIFFYYCMLFF